MEENKLRWKGLPKFIKCNFEVSPGPCAIAFEHLQGWKFHSLSQMLNYSDSENVFSYI